MAVYKVAVLVEGAQSPVVGQVEAGNRAGAFSKFQRQHGLTKVASWKAWAVDEDGTPRAELWQAERPVVAA